MPSDDLPGLEPDPTPQQPIPIPEIQDVQPATYDGLTNAQLDEWFDEVYGGQAKFESEFGELLDDMQRAGKDTISVGDVYDPDLRSVLETLLRHTNAEGGRSFAMLASGWFPTLWKHLGPETKARFRRWADADAEFTTPRGKDKAIVGTAIAAIVLGGFFYYGFGRPDPVPADTTSPPTTLEDTATTTTTEADSPPTTLEVGADPEGDMLGSPGIGDPDSAEAAASDITATAYFLDDGEHVFQMKVRGDGEALATGDVQWYNPRFIITTSQGEFTIDVRADKGTAQVIDPGPFSDPEQISVEVDWLEPGCLQVAATIIGMTEEATSFRTELAVRLADGTDFSDDASFGE